MSNGEVRVELRERRLSAILAADVVGYSRLMGADEEGTLHALKSHRAAVVDPAIANHRGRIVKTTGDGMLVEFASAVDAVRCAVDVQRGMAERNEGVPPERRIEFRIGINVGDIIGVDDDIYGDGVNVAARLEAMSEPGCICVSLAVRDLVRDKLAFGFEDLGEVAAKNIARPIHAFRVRPNVRNAVPSGDISISTRPRLSIVVLPFQNLGGDPADNYLAGGITEDLTSDLSLLPGAFVIARGSANVYQGKAIDIRRMGSELGVRYVVEGSVRRMEPILRVNAQLISTETGAHLWSDRFDQAMSDLAAGQEQIVTRMRAALAIGLTDIEAMRSARERPTSADAFDFILRARAERIKPETPETLAETARLYELALQQDPKSVLALTGAAEALAESSLVYETLGTLDRAAEYIDRALQLEPHARSVMVSHLFLLRVLEQWSAVAEAARRLIEAYPNIEAGYNHLAIAKINQGRLEEAIPLNEASMRLNPRNPQIYFRYARAAYIMVLLGRDEEAIAWAERGLSVMPRNGSARWRVFQLFIQAAAYARSGRSDAARHVLAEAQRFHPFDTVRTRHFPGPASPELEAYHRSYQDALRLAGCRDHADPDADYRVASDALLHPDLAGLTPIAVPGATTLGTSALITLLEERKPLVIDTMLYSWGRSIPGAVGLRKSGVGGDLADHVQIRLRLKLPQLTACDLSLPIVAVGWNSERFDGRNLALRLVALGCTNVYWYRGGREAWEVAGLPETAVDVQDW